MNGADCVSESWQKENLMKESECRRGFLFGEKRNCTRAVQKPKRNGKKLPAS